MMFREQLIGKHTMDVLAAVGESISAIAKAYSTSRQTIMRIRDGC